MAVKWLSINDIERLVKQKMYQFETGSKPSDKLVYDRKSRKYVGHIEGEQFHQNASYEPPRYIINILEDFDNDWSKNGGGW